MSKKLALCLVDLDAAERDSFLLIVKPAGINLVSFGSAQEYLGGFKPKNIGCIVLDGRMPGIGGLELQDILRQRKVHIPVIVLANRGDINRAVQAVKNGAFDVVEMPFNPELLLDRILKAFDVFSDWQKVEVERREVAVRIGELTRRELEVLDLMVSGRTTR